MSESAEEKRRVRATMREKRRALSAVEQHSHALQLRAFIQHQSWFKSARALGFYWASDGEISLTPLMQLSWRLGKHAFLPCVERPGQMRFRLFRYGDRLRRNRYGIPEPSPQAPAAGLEDLDILFVPTVAFTDDGDRLGMGGGYYDRALSYPGRLRRSLRETSHPPVNPRRGSPLLVGVAHACQRVPTLPREAWDVAMDRVVTEQGCSGLRGIGRSESHRR